MTQDFPFGHFFKSNNNKKYSDIKKSNDFASLSDDKNIISDNATIDQSELALATESVHSYISNKIPASKYSTYFESNLRITKIQEDKIHFNISTEFIKNIITKHYLDVLSDSLLSILGKKYEISIEVNRLNTSSVIQTGKNAKDVKFMIDLNETSEDLAAKAESKYINHVNPEQSNIITDTSKTFENFIVGPSNQLAFATSIAVADTPGKVGKYPCLYIHSNSGLGKTHLLHAVANGIKEKYPELIICLITAREFMKEMIAAYQFKKLSEFQKKYSEHIDVLMIDDIQELKNKTGTQNEFFHIFNELHNKGKQLIFTSDKAPREIDGIEERIRTRLQWGLVIDIQKPDLETRIAILRRKAYELDLFLPDDVLNLIATSIKVSIRELEGSLIKLSAYADVMNIEIDTEMTKELLSLTLSEDAKEITIESIAKATSQYFKITIADLKSKARSKEIVRARHIAMYLSKKTIDATLKEIARFYGGRDHTSVIHGVNKMSTKLKTDLSLSKDIICIESNI